MLKLMLLRHAKAVHSSQYDDIERPLTERGKADATLMGGFIAAHQFKPDLALVSSSCRTRETWDIVKEYTGQVVPLFEEALYHASAEEMLKRLRTVEGDASAVLLVGHNPGIALLAHALTGSGDDKTRRTMHGKFPTCALAVLGFDAVSWRDIRPGDGKLLHFVYPKLFGGSDD